MASSRSVSSELGQIGQLCTPMPEHYHLILLAQALAALGRHGEGLAALLVQRQRDSRAALRLMRKLCWIFKSGDVIERSISCATDNSGQRGGLEIFRVIAFV